jgi:hypothetical protein
MRGFGTLVVRSELSQLNYRGMLRFRQPHKCHLVDCRANALCTVSVAERVPLQQWLDIEHRTPKPGAEFTADMPF